MRSHSRWAFAPAVLAGAALALHAVLLRTDPAADALVEEAPAEVRLWFSEEVRPAPDPVVVVDPQGRRVDAGGGVSPDDRTQLRAAVSDGGPGTYSVRWRALSEDGHVIEGGYNYSVQSESTPATPQAEAVAGAGQAQLLVLARAVHLVGLTLALGALALGLLVGPAPAATVGPIARTGLVGALILLAAAPLMLFAQGAAAGGSLAGAFSGAALGAVFGTPWGGLWVARLVAALGLTAIAVLARGSTPGRPVVTLGLVLGTVLLFATSANGHALTTEPVWLSVTVDAVHLAATAAWLGGGVALAALVWAARRGGTDEATSLDALTRVTPRFSALALASVQILVVTGFYQTWAHVSSPSLLTSTGYGKALLVKLGLFALIAAPAGLNRFVMKPRIAQAAAVGAAERSSLAARFGRVLALEGSLGAAVLVAAALLSTLPPAEAVAAPAPMPAMEHDMSEHMATMASAIPARVWSAPAGDFTAILSVDPGLIGSNQTRITIHDEDGLVVTPEVVSVRTHPPEASGLRPSLVRMERAGDAYEALLGLGAEGDWKLELLLDGESRATFALSVAP